VITPATWNTLLRYQPLAVKWTATKRSLKAAVARAGAQALPVPRSASLRAKRDELGGSPGMGSPGR
jgi:SH3-like domain-containing protein